MLHATPRLTSTSRRLRALLAAAVAGLLAATLAPGSAASASPPDGAGNEGPADPVNIRAKIMYTMNHMSVEEKVGQLFVTYAYGESATTQDPADASRNQAAYGVDNAAGLIDKYHLGGMIYFTWSDNLANPKQIAKLSNGIQRAATDQPAGTPLLVSTDQEQGIVTRVGPPATQFPGNMALGAGRSTDDTRTAAKITGRELAAMGINQDFAPVADVNVNPENPVIGVRSFAAQPGLAADMTGAAVQGFQDAGTVATAKHFPGHGDTNVDSHTGLPVIDHTREEWQNLDLPPFRTAIDQGIGAIMTAHLVMPALDPSGDPATLSKPIMTGILREELGYDGVVITDSLSMAAVREQYGDAQVPVRALQAGVDMLLMPPDLDLAYNSVLDAVRSGEVSKRRLNEAVYRILRLKYQRGLFDDPYVDPGKVDERVGTPESYETAQRITDRTVTLVKNDDDVLPLQPGDAEDVLVTGWGAGTTDTLADEIAQRGPSTQAYTTGSSPGDEEIATAVDEARQHDLTVVTTSAAWNDSGQQELVRALVDTGERVVVIAVRDAYDIAHFTEASTYLATYSWQDVSLESAARVLFGEVSPTGTLPVAIPAADDPDDVLFPFGFGSTYGG